jgi:hypothetical protein
MLPLLRRYLDSCPSMSIFLVGALYALAFGMLLPSIMVVAFDGYQQRKLEHIAWAPAMHTAASLLVSRCVLLCEASRAGPALLCCPVRNGCLVLCCTKAAHAWDDAPCHTTSYARCLQTLLNFRRNGCNIVVPLLLAIGVCNMVYAGMVSLSQAGGFVHVGCCDAMQVCLRTCRTQLTFHPVCCTHSRPIVRMFTGVLAQGRSRAASCDKPRTQQRVLGRHAGRCCWA